MFTLHLHLPSPHGLLPHAAKTDGDRELPLTKGLLHQVLRQFSGLDAVEVSQYTYRSHHSLYPDAIAEIYIYDGAGRLVIQGREFSNVTALWSAPPPMHEPSPQVYSPREHGKLL